MTKEELEQKEIELLSKYTDKELLDYISLTSFHILTDGGLLEKGVDLEELKVHLEICQSEYVRRQTEKHRRNKGVSSQG